jgi:probable rRNA maturation factor
VRLHPVDRRRDPDALFDARRLEALAALCAPAGRAAWSVNLVLVDDGEMADLNRGWRGRAEPTDVLSFSYLEPEGAGAPALARGAGCAARDLWRDAAGDDDEPVGEVVLAPAFVRERCRRHGWPLETEIALLTVHGVLHILGWEHADAHEAAAMRAREEELLARGGLAHPLTGRGNPS